MGTANARKATITVPCEPKVERAALAAIYFGEGDPADLTPDDFHRPSHRAAFMALRETQGQDTESRARAVAAAMPEDSESRRLARALDVLGEQFCSGTWGIYVDILHRLALRRKLMAISGKMIGWSQDGAASYDDLKREVAGYLVETARSIEAL